MRQCTCGRSKIYPYCDGTHNDKIVKNPADETKDSVDLKNTDKN